MTNPPEGLRLPTNKSKTTNNVLKKKQKTAVIQVKSENNLSTSLCHDGHYSQCKRKALLTGNHNVVDNLYYEKLVLFYFLSQLQVRNIHNSVVWAMVTSESLYS